MCIYGDAQIQGNCNGTCQCVTNNICICIRNIPEDRRASTYDYMSPTQSQSYVASHRLTGRLVTLLHREAAAPHLVAGPPACGGHVGGGLRSALDTPSREHRRRRARRRGRRLAWRGGAATARARCAVAARRRLPPSRRRRRSAASGGRMRRARRSPDRTSPARSLTSQRRGGAS